MNSTRSGGGVSRRRRRLTTAALLVLVVLATLTTGAEARHRPLGDVRVLAPVPTPPGFPESVAVFGQRVYVSGPATFGTAGGPPSAVLVYSRSGRLLDYIPTEGENLAFEHANSNIALDRQGRVYVLNTQLGVYRLGRNGSQEAYATFPDLPQCGVAPPPCSPTVFDGPALPNDLAFDAAGNLYVTDSLQATIWRIPPGGGTAEIWFQDIRLASTTFGPNGIRISPDGSRVFFIVSDDLDHQAYVYSLPLVPDPDASDLQVFHQYSGGEIPDALAFGRNGDLYVSLANPPDSGISILAPDGHERLRLGNPPGSLLEPYDSPAGMAFDGTGSLLVANHAVFSANPAHFAVLDVYVGDRGAPLFLPVIR
jgi:sugar lactone lactonase YvrE